MSDGSVRNHPCACGSGKKTKVCCGAHALSPARSRVALMVCMATRGAIAVETHVALASHMDGVDRVFVNVAREPVDVARNRLAAEVLRFAEGTDVEFVLSVDDDMFWAPGTVAKMMSAMRADPKIDVLAGWYGLRRPLSPPTCFRGAGKLDSYPRPGVDFQNGDVVEVSLVGFPFVMYRPELLRRLGPDPFSIPADANEREYVVTEDFAFCERVSAIGGRIFVHTDAWIAHVDASTGLAYLPGAGPLRVEGAQLVNAPGTAAATAEVRDYGGGVNVQVDRHLAGLATERDHFASLGIDAEDVRASLRWLYDSGVDFEAVMAAQADGRLKKSAGPNEIRAWWDAQGAATV